MFFVGNWLNLMHVGNVNAEAQLDPLASPAAEEVLRTIYGDDLTGCVVRLDTVAAIIDQALKQKAAQSRELLELYEKVVEAVQLLSTPPDAGKVADPKEFQALLSERLDAVRVVTGKTIETTGLFKKKVSGPAGD